MAKKKTSTAPGVTGTPLLTGDHKQKVDQVSSGTLVSQANPELQSRIASSQQDLTDQYQRSIFPTLSRQAEAAGRFGSDAYQMAQGQAAQGLTRALGDVSSNMRFQDYNARMADMMQGLGLGTQMYGYDSQAESQRQAAASAAASQAAAIAAQQAMQTQELQFKAQQAMQQGDLATMQMMLDAAGQMGALQGNALGNLPNIDQMGGMGFLSGFLGQSAGLDQMGAQHGLAQQGLGLQRQGLNQDQQRLNLMQQAQQYGQQADAFQFMNQNPWDQLNNYGNLINALTGQYGTTTSQGHQTTPYMGPSSTGAMIQGGLGGFMLGGGGNAFSGGGRQQAPPQRSYYNDNAAGDYWAGNPW